MRVSTPLIVPKRVKSGLEPVKLLKRNSSNNESPSHVVVSLEIRLADEGLVFWWSIGDHIPAGILSIQKEPQQCRCDYTDYQKSQRHSMSKPVPWNLVWPVHLTSNDRTNVTKRDLDSCSNGTLCLT
ncbi:hypothetical protein OGAPHI_006847 [Ogataea philodendri]|uniref:Uncharacterized protein n=1 Tax=Ogataea philodendri TaxID=1378263 RepID=A0A9P8NX83_9ASCO|nr:uncharacterized protein OGAPHI_006847 [Ogataea philodendri]KAH3661440.1 hypothetical protein OGAPHI_006847 [Ogataea philodendri]